MSSTSPDVAAALLSAAQVLPAHFADAAELTITELDAIQATTMSLPGGAYAVESVLTGAQGNVGNVTLIVTGLIDHKTGEIFSRDDARTFWTAALEETLTPLKESFGDFTPGQIHLTDAFDALDQADEATVVGIFKDETLAGMLLALPETATGAGAAAQLAAAVAEAEAAQAAENEEPVAGEPEASDESAAATTQAPDADVPAAAAEAAVSTAGAAPTAAGPYAGSAQEQAAAAARAQADAERHAAMQQALLAEGVSDVAFQPFAGMGMGLAHDPRRIDLLRDVVMGVSVELGRTRLTVQEILGLTPGSIVELDRAAGAPVDVLVNGTLIAHGEVVVVDEEFAVRISEVVTPDRDGRVTA